MSLHPAASGAIHIWTKGPGRHEKCIKPALLPPALPLHALPSCPHLCGNCGPTSVHGVRAPASSCSAHLKSFFCNIVIFFHCFPSRFPSDPGSQTVDEQFLWGSSLLISPVLKRGAVEVAAYLPPGTWYSLLNVSRVCCLIVSCRVLLSL